MSKKSKLSLLIDGNWLLMSRMYIVKSKYDSETEFIKELEILMLKGINIVLNTFPDIDNIMFLTDGGSWRNYIEKPKFLEEDYKCKRPKDEESMRTTWDAYNELMNRFRDNNINVYHEPGIEGDDWIWYWSEKLNEEGTNCIIWTKDKDLTQLVKNDNNKCFTVWWNKDNGLYTSIEKNDEDMNFFFNPVYNTNEQLYNRICEKCKDINIINTNEVVIDKIIKGDISDNILPIIQRESKGKTKRLYNISAKDMNYSLDIKDYDKIKEFIHNIVSSKSYSDRLIHKEEEIFEHFKYNKKLIQLAKENYPQEVLDVFNKYTTYVCNKNITDIINKISSEKVGLTNILDLI